MNAVAALLNAIFGFFGFMGIGFFVQGKIGKGIVLLLCGWAIAFGMFICALIPIIGWIGLVILFIFYLVLWILSIVEAASYPG